MKNTFLIAMFALSVGAFPQPRSIQGNEPSRNSHVVREIGRQVNKKGNDYSYKFNKIDFKGLQLSRNQEKQLDELFYKMQNEMKIAQRNNRKPDAEIRKIQKAYDLKISKLLSKYQYDKFMNMYAYHYFGNGYGRV